MKCELLRGICNAAVALVFPELCQVCEQERAGAAAGFVCNRCRAGVRFIGPPFCDRCGLPYPGDITTDFECANCRDLKLHFRFARSAVTTGGPVLECIRRYKYQRALWFEPFLGELLVRQADPELAGGSWDCLVPVPLHATRQREREFNQAERLARRLGAATKLPVRTGLLERVLPTFTQTKLTREQRAENVKGAFIIRKGVRLNRERIVLIDDVFTTGATTSACAGILRKAGAADVCVWTVARGL
ncbi:MAG TPA: ComF family protein [Verrucomicrobiae bacterium]|nr:ComF family protein [Verrucomicrobiae bacterium]